VIDIGARRRAFRDGILRDASAMAASLVGAQRTTRIVDIPLVIGTRGVALAVNDHVFFRLGLNGTVTILTWSLAGTIAGASASGTITVDVMVGATLAAAATIAPTSKPTLTAQAELADQTPAASWTLQIADPVWIKAIITSTGGTLEMVSLTLRCAVG
jgi:hypothetical protein